MIGIKPTVKTYVASVSGVCGGDAELIVKVKPEMLEAVVAQVSGRCVTRKAVEGVMYELEFGAYVFRLFCSGRIVFRGVRSRREFNRLLRALLL